MDIYVFNEKLELKGILDVYQSLRWTRRLTKSGTFELHCTLTDNTLKLLQRGNIIFKNDDDLEAGVIETRQLRVNIEGQEVLQVNGHFLTNYLERRINWGRTLFNGNLEDLVRKLVEDNAINPTDPTRVLSNLELGPVKGFDDVIRYQNSYGNLATCLENLAESNNFGFRLLLNLRDRKLVFDMFRGVDRTLRNGKLSPCVFSRDFENILEQEYVDSVSNYRNTALIAGAGEGDERLIESIVESSGYSRYELYVDARDLSNTRTINEEEVPIPNDEYRAMLLQRGNEKLSELNELKTFDSKINVNGNNKYRVDFDLGDTVTVVDKKWDVKLNSKISEIEEVYEESGLKINVIFGNSIPNIMDKIEGGF